MIDRKKPSYGIVQNSMFETDVPDSTLDYSGLLEACNGGIPAKSVKIAIDLTEDVDVSDFVERDYFKEEK